MKKKTRRCIGLFLTAVIFTTALSACGEEDRSSRRDRDDREEREEREDRNDGNGFGNPFGAVQGEEREGNAGDREREEDYGYSEDTETGMADVFEMDEAVLQDTGREWERLTLDEWEVENNDWFRDLVTPQEQEFTVEYDENLQGVVLSHYTGDATRIRIPDTVSGGTVVGVKNLIDLDNDSEKIEVVWLPDSIRVIGKYAFQACSIQAVRIPEGVTEIAESAFSYCDKLQVLRLPDSLEVMGKEAFNECEALEEIWIPFQVTELSFWNFIGCEALERVWIPEGVTEIDCGAFQKCSSLREVRIPESVTRIKSCAFQECSSLREIRIPEGVTSLEWGMFFECSSLETVYLPESLTEIENTAFYGCSALRTITIPDGVTTIEDRAFGECDRLTIRWQGNTYDSETIAEFYK